MLLNHSPAIFSNLSSGHPTASDGIIYWRGVVYASTVSISDQPFGNLPPGRLLAYDARTGKLLREFNPNTFPKNFSLPHQLSSARSGHRPERPPLCCQPAGCAAYLFPSRRPDPGLDPETFDFLGVFVNDLNEEGEIGHLNRPDSLVFSPDGKLYVTSFRASEDDSDSIRIYDGHTGVFLNKIELYTPPSPPAARAFAQGILFGPGGKLFIAIAGGDGTTVGRIWTYDVKTKTLDEFAEVPTLPTLWYITFGKTNPGTLAYDDDDRHGGRRD